MTYQLRLGEMIEAMERADMPEAKHFVTALEVLGTDMARRLADKLGIACGEVTHDVGMFAAPFYAVSDDQPMPEAIEDFDMPEEWGTE
jgi:hypothetical protein